MININNIIKHELIGLKAEIVDSRNKANIGIKGKIIDETKNTIIIEHKSKKKRLFKSNITIALKIKNRTIQINGKLLIKKPKDRLSK